MSEAVEYRIKRTRQILFLMFAALVAFLSMCLYGLAFVSAELGMVDLAYILGGWFMLGFITTFSLIIKTRGQSERGYCRVFWEWWTSEYPDPPLDEWEQDLEERGVFEVTNHE